MGVSRRSYVLLCALLGCSSSPVEGGEDTDSGTDATGSDGTSVTSGVSDSTTVTSTSGAGSGGATSSGSTTTGGSGSSGGASGATDSATGGGASTGGATGASGGATTGGQLTCADLNPPDGAPATCSVNSNTAATVEFINMCETESIEILWVNYQCEEVLYQTLAPGESHVQGTFEGHPWRIREAGSGKLLVDDINPPAGASVVEVP